MRFRSAMIFAVAIAAAACSSDKTPKSTAPDSTAIKKPVTYDGWNRPVGPMTRKDKVNSLANVNGNSIVQTSELITPPSSFPLKFTTYKNSDMQMATMVTSGVETLSLTPVFGTQTDPDAFVQISFDTIPLPANSAADSTLQTMTTGRKVSGLSTAPADSSAWATDAKTFHMTADGKKLSGTVIVGRRGKYTYRVYTQYPDSRGAAVRSRLREILTQWRWEDDNSYLVPAPPAPPASSDSAARAAAAKAAAAPAGKAPASKAPASKPPVKK